MSYFFINKNTTALTPDEARRRKQVCCDGIKISSKNFHIVQHLSTKWFWLRDVVVEPSAVEELINLIVSQQDLVLLGVERTQPREITYFIIKAVIFSPKFENLKDLRIIGQRLNKSCLTAAALFLAKSHVVNTFCLEQITLAPECDGKLPIVLLALSSICTLYAARLGLKTREEFCLAHSLKNGRGFETIECRLKNQSTVKLLLGVLERTHSFTSLVVSPTQVDWGADELAFIRKLVSTRFRFRCP